MNKDIFIGHLIKKHTSQLGDKSVILKGYLVALIIFSTSSLSLAGGYTGPAKIDWMTSIVKTGSARHFVLSGTWNNPDGCTNTTENIWIIKDPDDSIENLNSMYSMALAAYMSGKPIELYENGCENNRPKAVSMYLEHR